MAQRKLKKGNQKEKSEKNKFKYFKDENHLRMVWWLYNAEQLKEELPQEEIEEINQYVREENDPDLWEI